MNAIPQRQAFCCPSCGGFIGEASPVSRIVESGLSDQQMAIVTALSNPVGDWVGTNDLLTAVYVGPMCSTTGNRRHVALLISKAQEPLFRLGWAIVSDNKGRYRLIPHERSY